MFRDCRTGIIVRGARVCACICLALSAFGTEEVGGAGLFQDDFESGVLRPEWTTSGTNTWRVQVTSSFGPAGGSNHLVFDDSVDDSVNSVAEATLALDLSYKKNVVLSFSA